MNKKQNALNATQSGVTEPVASHILALFQRNRDALERYLAYRLRCREEAKELAQETYIRLTTRRKRRKVNNWEALLWCTARNLANNRLNQHRARQAAGVLMQIETKDDQTPEKFLTDEYTTAAIKRAIDQLSERQKQIIARLNEGQRYRQIARELRVNERTCRRDLKEAILDIQQKLGLERGS